MRNPELENLYAEENTQLTVNVPEDLPRFNYQPYSFLDDKEINKYIKDLKKFVRNSYEYKTVMVPFLRDHVGMNHCSVMPNLTNEGRTKIRIEIHHDPLDLETICRVVFRKRSHMGEDLSIPATAYEVLWCHYSMLVGLVPLSETAHELVHNGNIFINPNKVFGFYKVFVQRYYEFFTDEELDVLSKIDEKAQQEELDYSMLLAVNPVQVNMNNDVAKFAAIQSVKENANDRLVAKENLKSISVSKPPVRLFREPEEQRAMHQEFEDYWRNKMKEGKKQ